MTNIDCRMVSLANAKEGQGLSAILSVGGGDLGRRSGQDFLRSQYRTRSPTVRALTTDGMDASVCEPHPRCQKDYAG